MIEGLVGGAAKAAARRVVAEQRARERALLESGWSCPHCGVKRVPVENLPGSSLVNVLLYALLVVPALKYWDWRQANKWYTCAACSRRIEPPAWYAAGAAPPAPGQAGTASAGAGFRCSRCGSTHPPAVKRRGSTVLHVLLYCCWIIPGYLYGRWRKAEPGTLVCDRCGMEVGPEPA